jgi:hypothetical protein
MMGNESCKIEGGILPVVISMSVYSAVTSRRFGPLRPEQPERLKLEYPRPHLAVDAGVAPVAIELNTFIDAILERIQRFGGNRTIIISSFTPEVRTLLSIKQQRYKVMLITRGASFQ